MKGPSKQRGMGWFGLMFMFILIGFFGLVGMKCWPIVFNEAKLERAVKSVAHDPEVAAAEAPEKVRSALQKWWNVEDIEFLLPADVKVRNTGNGRVLAYDYWAQTNLFKNVYVSFHYTHEEPFPKSGF
ncbi:MAG TPA: DUF4845 domain-containing protein [Nevskiaceae bacterium]|nr:DUF4845 domain-containing protein [Nevskiaceae bacterium]